MILFVVIICLTISKLVDPALRIRWGEDANVEQYPYIGTLLYKFNKTNNIVGYGCTCTILKPMWTLTAAHCILNEGKKKIYYLIGYGTWVLVKNYSTRYVVEVHKHPAYISELQNDIALLKTEPIVLSRYGRVSAVDYTTLIGQAVLVFGYGLMQHGQLSSNPFKLGKPLQVADMVIQKCEPRREFLYYYVCLRPRCEKAAVLCPGDSGGPLIHPSGLIAVNSYGFSLYCREDFIPDAGEKLVGSGGATPVSPYIDWITSIIKK